MFLRLPHLVERISDSVYKVDRHCLHFAGQIVCLFFFLRVTHRVQRNTHSQSSDKHPLYLLKAQVPFLCKARLTTGTGVAGPFLCSTCSWGKVPGTGTPGASCWPPVQMDAGLDRVFLFGHLYSAAPLHWLWKMQQRRRAAGQRQPEGSVPLCLRWAPRVRGSCALSGTGAL